MRTCASSQRPGVPVSTAGFLHRHASGDGNPGDGRRGAFDQLSPSAHNKFYLADQCIWSNLRHGRGQFEIQVRPALALMSSNHSFCLAGVHPGLYAPAEVT